MIVFINCGAKKQNCECVAEEMYIGNLFTKSLQYAKKLNPTKIYILSAKYGVLELSDKISPYNQTLKNAKQNECKKWAYMCYRQLLAKKVNFNDDVVFLAGEKYRKYLMPLFKKSKCPISGLRMGKQAKFYKDRL